MAVGSILLGAPFALGLSPAAIAAGAGIGVVTIGLGLAGTAPSGRGTVSVGAHKAYDQGLALGLLIGAAAFFLAAEPAAGLLFAATGLFQLLLGGFTRYTATPAS